MTTAQSSPSDGRVLSSALVSTVAGALSSFLTGALGVQISDALGFGPVTLGLAIASFGAGAAVTSAMLGAHADTLGPRPALRIGLLGAAATAGAIAIGAHNAVSLMAILALAGVANALVQPSVNAMLSHGIHHTRQGLAFGIKQSGLPAASLIGGIAVPAIALTVGWRWAFAGAAVLALGAFAFVPHLLATSERSRSEADATPDAPVRLLWVMTAAMALAASAAAGLAGFLVSGAVHVGIGKGAAGLLLGLGSLLSILSRLAMGRWADRSGRSALTPVVIMLGTGSVALLVMSTGNAAVFAVATPVAFFAGWGWPGLFNLAVVRVSRDTPGKATGITQTGTYVGILAGPLLFGVLAETISFSAAWATGGALMAVAAVAMAAVERSLGKRSLSPGPR